jgi:hypothetical protein
MSYQKSREGQAMFDITNLENKNQIISYEGQNHQYIILFPTSKEFWSATLNSALILFYEYQKPLGLGNRLHSTMDYYLKHPRIYTAYNATQYQNIKQNAKKVGLKVVRDDEKLLALELPHPLPDSKFHDWYRREEIRKQRITSYLLPDSGHTEIYNLIRQLYAKTIVVVDNMRENLRPVLGPILLGQVATIYRQYLSLEKDNPAPEIMTEQISELAFLVASANDQSAILDKHALAIGSLIQKLLRAIKTTENSNDK